VVSAMTKACVPHTSQSGSKHPITPYSKQWKEACLDLVPSRQTFICDRSLHQSGIFEQVIWKLQSDDAVRSLCDEVCGRGNVPDGRKPFTATCHVRKGCIHAQVYQAFQKGAGLTTDLPEMRILCTRADWPIGLPIEARFD